MKCQCSETTSLDAGACEACARDRDELLRMARELVRGDVTDSRWVKLQGAGGGIVTLEFSKPSHRPPAFRSWP